MKPGDRWPCANLTPALLKGFFMFGRSKDEAIKEPLINSTAANEFVVVSKNPVTNAAFLAALTSAINPLKVVCESKISAAYCVLALFLDTASLTDLFERVLKERETRKNNPAVANTPSLIIALNLSQLSAIGTWLETMAVATKLQGVRLVIGESEAEILEQITDKLTPTDDPNFIKMPVTPEVENTTYKYFYTFSPDLRKLTRTMHELAQNNITRVYLLGGPGAGKTSLAYYYWCCRKKGNFVAVNLNSESTGDKSAMKSLLCGHVTGAFPGTGSREGALAFAKDGVCFLDESHGVTGTVMQVLMEVLDSGQFLPYGATVKRSLECAVIFASNRSWETLRSMIQLDEHARLGATLLTLSDLSVRREDMLAVIATSLAKFKKQYTTWRAAEGLTPAAWEAIKACPWRGNTRTLIRVLETASVSFCLDNTGDNLLDAKHIQEGIDLWEPADHESLKVYVSHKS